MNLMKVNRVAVSIVVISNGLHRCATAAICWGWIGESPMALVLEENA